jgi:deoxyribodipyrimidine photolyase-related protein
VTTLCVVLGDQLNTQMSALQSIDKDNDHVLLAEVNSEATYVKHHKKKIAFIFSAMRHFAVDLKEQGFQVSYVHYLDKDNKGSLLKQVEHFISQHPSIDRVVLAKPAEYRLFEEVSNWHKILGVDVDITQDNRFIATENTFSNWASDGRKQLRMEYFYREMRKSTYVLMDGDKPVKDKWNFDADNREKLPKEMHPPAPTVFEIDEITQSVIDLVGSEFADHFGDVDGFHYAVTRVQALHVLDEFIEQRLENFGRYQDAMVQDQPWMYHSHISFYLNTGLLMPLEVIEAAEQAYRDGQAPINSVEGFIRQVLGWREYIRGFYWYLMPEYKHKNALNATRALPDFFWGKHTNMNCISQSVKQTKEHAYAHHIQRLMVLGNFALLTGLSPEEVNEWYLIVYADAYEWVELPNVSGMVLFADGGKLASKPYAASGAYINKMSNYCQHCQYSVKEKTGPQACPFNYLYWGFLNKHKEALQGNPRMAMIYRTMNKMDQTRFAHMLDDADTFLLKLDNNEEV